MEVVILNYFLANAWNGLHQLSGEAPGDSWEWHRREFEREIVHLRTAVRSGVFSSVPKIRQCQIHTNLGNALSTIGRFVDALEHYDRTLELDKSFGMAQGNRGMVLVGYARCLYDQGHAMVFLAEARRELNAALRRQLEGHAREAFGRTAEWVTAMLRRRRRRLRVDLMRHPMGKSKAEERYRRWCLAERLFLNPLNDLGAYPIGARDILTTPSIRVGLDEGPYYPGFFNQMKQEFVSARYLYYEGVVGDRLHFSDREVFLYNTLDYPVYSLGVERVKATFRIVYSLFDKIAFFLNQYLGLGIAERQVSFRALWYEKQDRRREVRPEFSRRANWPLRGLFWVAKDLHEDATEFREVMDPDAERLAEIRNHLEHKYLKVHDPLIDRAGIPAGMRDSLAYSVSRADLEAKALRLLKIARASLIYLSLGIHTEERSRAARNGTKLVAPVRLDRWEDDWKK
jgi:hypothetical protein